MTQNYRSISFVAIGAATL